MLYKLLSLKPGNADSLGNTSRFFLLFLNQNCLFLIRLNGIISKLGFGGDVNLAFLKELPVSVFFFLTVSGKVISFKSVWFLNNMTSCMFLSYSLQERGKKNRKADDRPYIIYRV